jgi:hypothetical protein
MRISVKIERPDAYIQTPKARKHIDWLALHDALIAIPNVFITDGPLPVGRMRVTYRNETRDDAALVAELRAICKRF